MTNLITEPTNTLEFMFEDNEVRVVRDEQGDPWFVAKDVADPLGYTLTSAMTRSLDDDEKGMQVIHTLGGKQQMSVINESGLFSAILRSERPEAKRMKKWVTSEVLPSIRKTGSYSMQAKPLTAAEMFLQSAQTMLMIEQRTALMEKQQQEVKQNVAIQATKLLKVESAISEVKETNLLTSCPSAAESITGIRLRMNEDYGLSASVVDAVMRQSLYAPKPVGMVRNQHESSGGSTYAVYWKKDVSNVFKMFVSQCEKVSATLYKHPFVEGKFKLNK